MKTNKQLRAWLEMGVGRGTALASILGCSRQYVQKVSSIENGLSDKQWNEIKFGISIVELDEKSKAKKIEQIIIKAARLSHSKDREVKKFAQIELGKWVESLRVAA